MKQTARDIRRNNRLAVLRHIYVSGLVSRQDLTQRSGLSTATVANVVTDLLASGVVTEAGFEDSQGGRPRAMLTVNAERGFFIGIDIAETYIHFDLFDMMLQHRHSIVHMLHSEENQPAQVIEHVTQGIDGLLSASQTPRSAVLGVGVSLPGLVERSGGVSVFAPNWGWHDVPLYDLLKQKIEMPLYIDNPLKATALAELWFGAGQYVDNMVTLTIGTGIGAGVIINGQVFRGTTNSAGEWGHTTIVLDGRECRCGNHGCLEAYVGAPGILQQIADIAPDHPILAIRDQTDSINQIADAAERGDPVIIKALYTTAHYLGAGIANMINLFNPQIIVLGGWVGRRLGPYMLEDLQQFVARNVLKPPLGAAQIQFSQLHHNPVSTGVATLALEGFLATIDTSTNHSRA